MPLLLLLMPGLLAAQIKPPLVIPEATISPSHIAFIFGGQIWEIPRTGGHARRLTEGPETHRNPVYSPDGSQILFTRSDVGENNIYVMPARGGEMKPLTYHPGLDMGWDQRMNGGGITGDSLVQMLLRKPMLGYVYPHGEPFDVPAHRVDGPVVLIADHQNGSAAETFALMFKAMKVGKIVGTSTYGAGVGVALAQQRLIDGGRIGIPNRASHNPLTGEWEIENRGVTPDVEVDISTADFVAGRDPQLEKAVEVAMKQLTSWKVKELKRPKFPLHPLGGG